MVFTIVMLLSITTRADASVHPVSAKSSIQVASDSLDTLIARGNSLRESGSYAEAILLYQQALEGTRSQENPTRVAKRLEFQALNELAILNNEIGDQSRSLDYHKQAESIAQSLEDRRLLMQNFTAQGALYRGLDSISLSESYYRQAYDLAREISDTTYQLMNQFNLANISTEQGNLERAAQQYEEVRRISEAMGNLDGQLYSALNLAIVYGRLDLLDASKQNYDRVAMLLEDNDQALIRRRLYEGYASYYLKIGDTLRAEDYQLRFDALADQQIGTERQNRFLALQSDYEIRVKEQELALTRLEAERLSLRNQLYTIIGVFLFGAIIAVYILQRRRIERLRSLYERNLEIVRSGADRTGALFVDDLLNEMDHEQSNPLDETISTETTPQRLSVEEITKKDLYNAILKAFDEEELYRNPDLNLDDLAHKFGSNRRYVSECINQLGQTTFYALANTYRAKAARRKMIDSDNRLLSLKTVMLDCGFKNMATFHKYFKALTGMTPGEFMRVKK